MSAAEKLKVLEKHMRRHKTEMLYPESARLRDALPQIVAVVEAAQTVNDDLFFDPVLNAALAALDETLDNRAEASPTPERT